MFSPKMQDAMNEQIQAELYSAYIYLGMAAYYDAVNLPGFAHWMRLQTQEEMAHAMKFYHFIYDRGGSVVLQAIEQPSSEYDSPLAAFEETLAHEQKVTARIHDLYALAVEEKDYASQSFLQWFVDEQVEEEKTASEIVEQIKMIQDSKMGLFMLDRQLAGRQAEAEDAEQ